MSEFKVGDKVKRKALAGTARDAWTVVGAWGDYIFVTLHPDNQALAPVIRVASSYVKIEPFFEVGKTYQYQYVTSVGPRRFRVTAIGGEGGDRVAFGEIRDGDGDSSWTTRGGNDFQYYDEVVE